LQGLLFGQVRNLPVKTMNDFLLTFSIEKWQALGLFKVPNLSRDLQSTAKEPGDFRLNLVDLRTKLLNFLHGNFLQLNSLFRKRGPAGCKNALSRPYFGSKFAYFAGKAIGIRGRLTVAAAGTACAAGIRRSGAALIGGKENPMVGKAAA
jgi:hypothetical protein